jgi:hypothetical protein
MRAGSADRLSRLRRRLGAPEAPGRLARRAFDRWIVSDDARRHEGADGNLPGHIQRP